MVVVQKIAELVPEPGQLNRQEKTDAVSEKGKAAAVSIHSGTAKPEAGSLNAVLGIL